MPEQLYFPDRDEMWERRAPEQLGLDGTQLAEAARFASANETAWSTDVRTTLTENNRTEGPYGAIVGPVIPRGGVSGVILRHGYVVAEWGDPARVDMTFSASKSYLATLAGLALDRGLIRSIDDPVREYVDDGGFDPPHNS